jgi:hypothetical protein
MDCKSFQSSEIPDKSAGLDHIHKYTFHSRPFKGQIRSSNSTAEVLVSRCWEDLFVQSNMQT